MILKQERTTGPQTRFSVIYLVARWVFGIAAVTGLFVGCTAGAFQMQLIYGLYKAEARGVTLDTLYAVFHFWCFWIAASLGHLLSCALCSYQSQAGLIVGTMLLCLQAIVLINVLVGIGW
jgi:hypothetical protein